MFNKLFKMKPSHQDSWFSSRSWHWQTMLYNLHFGSTVSSLRLFPSPLFTVLPLLQLSFMLPLLYHTFPLNFPHYALCSYPSPHSPTQRMENPMNKHANLFLKHNVIFRNFVSSELLLCTVSFSYLFYIHFNIFEGTTVSPDLTSLFC